MRQTWHETGRNLRNGDIVLIHEKGAIKGKYLLGMVDSVNVGRDGLVRSCSVRYTVPNARDPIGKYNGGRRIVVTRSIQRLTLLLPVEEQNSRLTVEDNVVRAVKEDEIDQQLSFSSQSIEIV